MTITRLKAKNQITIPREVVKKLNLAPNELFAVEVEGNCIKLISVEIELRYTSDELKAIDKIVENNKTKGKVLESGKEFSEYIKNMGEE